MKTKNKNENIKKIELIFNLFQFVLPKAIYLYLYLEVNFLLKVYKKFIKRYKNSTSNLMKKIKFRLKELVKLNTINKKRHRVSLEEFDPHGTKRKLIANYR